jgi:ribosome biogenesis GTPase
LRPRGGSIIDTPGMRGVERWLPGNDSGGNFDDIETLALECKFSNCRHEAEPKCAVRAAVARGELDAGRVAGYVQRAREAKSSAR